MFYSIDFFIGSGYFFYKRLDNGKLVYAIIFLLSITVQPFIKGFVNVL